MNKKLLLLTLISLSAINYGNATCTPPTVLKCQCQHPIINSDGKLACGEDYCAKNNKKCMPNGSCCETEKYCESSIGKQCCSDEEHCDTIQGCIVACKNDCTTENDGTECCTSLGIAGLCLNGSCKTKTCNEGEKLYIYKDGSAAIVTHTSLGCCISDPNTTPLNNPSANSRQLCCTSNEPVYSRIGCNSSAECTSEYEGQYGCFKAKPELISCTASLSFSSVEEGVEACVNGSPANFASTPIQKTWGYCEKYTDWSFINLPAGYSAGDKIGRSCQ